MKRCTFGTTSLGALTRLVFYLKAAKSPPLIPIQPALDPKKKLDSKD